MIEDAKEKIYIGTSRRFVIQQTIGFSKVIDILKEKLDVRELRDGINSVILIEEKENEKQKD